MKENKTNKKTATNKANKNQEEKIMKKTTNNYQEMSKKELVEIAKGKGITVKAKNTKEVIIQAILKTEKGAAKKAGTAKKAEAGPKAYDILLKLLAKAGLTVKIAKYPFVYSNDGAKIAAFSSARDTVRLYGSEAVFTGIKASLEVTSETYLKNKHRTFVKNAHVAPEEYGVIVANLKKLAKSVKKGTAKKAK